MKVFFGILFLVVFGATGNALAVVEVDLTGDIEDLAFEAQPFPLFHVGQLKNRKFGSPGILFDVDGDGYQDLIRANFGYVAAVGYNRDNHVTYYQTNLPPEFCREDGPSFSISGEMDLDGDGASEIVVTGHTQDHKGWRFWILDPPTGDIEGSFDLPGGQEVRHDGIWDGNYFVAGMLECLVDRSSRTALVLCVNIGFDIEGRGVLAVDPWTGEILWRFVTGPNPLEHATKVVDLDGDGSAEVIVYGRSPDNLGGRKINGYSDNESRLFVLNSQGETLWTKRLGGWYGGGFLVTADLNSDGLVEIITSTHTTPEVWGEVVVWSHDGRSLARYTADDQLLDLAMVPAAAGRAPRLAVSAVSGNLKILEFVPPDLKTLAKIKAPAATHINCVADILPIDGVELVFSTSTGTTWVLDRNFQPVARFEIEKAGWFSRMMPWKPAPGIELLMFESGPGFPLQFARAPSPPLNKALVSTLGVVALFLVAGLILWKKIPRKNGGDPAVLREVRLNLLEDLELSNHGAIAPLKCLRRMIWHMNAMTSGLGDNPSIELRLRETWTDCVDNALPHMAGILDRARLAGLAGANVDFAARALDKARHQLGVLESEGFQVATFEPIAAELTTETARAEEALKDLRREVSGFFHTDLATTVTRVLRANSQSLEEQGISVQTGYLAQMAAGGEDISAGRASPSVTCLIDPKELDFVLDNLVGNAVRAMTDATSRTLALTWTTADGMVTIDVRDTGCGIPTKNHDRILETRFSTREGGGQGLPKSRKILRKYGGGLMILDTAPNHGTTFRLTLPTAM